MPGFDGTGPMGMGPMTGGGRGFCAVPMRDWNEPFGGRFFGRGRGRGWGKGGGFGRGLGWRHGWSGYGPAWGYPYGITPYYGDPNASEFTPQQEAEMLKKEAKAMQDEINSINMRISELESAAKKTE